jgi:hypothetical protein
MMPSLIQSYYFVFIWTLAIRSVKMVIATNGENADESTATTMTTTTTTSTMILLEDFSNPMHDWTTMNDPVMGGQSYSNVEIDPIKGIAHFTGQCAIVPSLDAPGFITMVTGGYMPWDSQSSKFPDISSCTAFRLELKSNTDYAGYRLSFGRAHPWGNHYAFGYKTPLTDLPRSEEFGILTLPFTSFSSKWDDATGNIQVSCQENSHYCPSPHWLQDIKTMSFWGEGIEGMVDLEIKTIAAVGCDGDLTIMQNGSTSHNYDYSRHHILAVSIVAVVTMASLIVVKKQHRYARLVQTAPYEEIQDSHP